MAEPGCLSLRLLMSTLMCFAVAGGAAMGGEPPESEGPSVKFGVEVKVHARDSKTLNFQVPAAVYPGDYGEPAVLSTPSPGRSFEISMVALNVDAHLASGIEAHGSIHFVDLYSRNPTSTGQRAFVREAWLQLGDRRDGLRPGQGSPLFMVVGMAPRFTREEGRRLESFGLWGVAVGWLEQLQVQVGGDIGRHVYWRAHVANPNPLYLRDTNALAGDSGYYEDGELGSGFPILYETRAPEMTVGGKLELGGGLGLRAVSETTRNGVDLLAWLFRRDLADRVSIPDSTWGGDLELLRAAGLQVRGRTKEERGANLMARLGGLRLFAQGVDQDIAGLERTGYEIELAYWAELPGLFATGDTPVVNWIQPAIRFSRINNRFGVHPPVTLPAALSLTWDWTKLDLGVRVGIVRGVDLTLEAARHDMILASGKKLHPDEGLATLRFSY